MMTIFSRAFHFAALLSFVGGLAGAPEMVSAQLKPLIQLEQSDGKPSEKPQKRVEMQLKPAQGAAAEAQPGDEVVLSITINVPAKSYTYSTTTEKGGKTRFSLQETGLEAVDKTFQPEREPKTAFEPLFEGNVEKYEKSITWTRRYRLTDDAQPENVQVEGQVIGQICDDRSCKPYKETVRVALIPRKESNANALTHAAQPKLAGQPGPAKVNITLEPQDAQPGDKVTLSVKMDIEENWHTYSITQKPGNFAQATTIQVEKSANLKALGEDFTPSDDFEIKKVTLGDTTAVQEVHHGTITWSRQYEVLPPAEDEGFGVDGKLKYQICDPTKCVPATVAFVLHTQPENLAADAEADSGPLDLSSITASSRNDVKKQGLMLFLISAAGFGFLALLTPCVFPMVPITISFFLKQAEKGHHRPATLASIYCGGIIATFTGLGLLMAALFEATALNQLANNPWLNLVLAGVIILFGISMLGVFEIRVPSWLLTWSAGKEQKGGIIGTLFMALTFTLVSFTCTFAFAGLLLVMASKGEVLWPVMGMLAFSAAFSFPFFLLALFPSFLKKLPKSGGWMNTVKVTMGFIEIGAALKFLSVADASWFGQPMYLTYNVVMIGWLITAAACGLYLLGLFRMPHDMPAKLSLPRVLFAVPFLLLAVLLGMGTFTEFRPTGLTQKVWQNVVAFAPIQPGEAGNDPHIGPWRKSHGIVYALSFEQAVEHARKTGRPLLLDFTGVNCVNCRKMENVIGDSPQHQRLNDFVAVQLYTDLIPDADKSGIADAQQVAAMLEINRKLQRHWFGDVQLPAYAVVHPNDLEVLERYTSSELAEEPFFNFLSEGLNKWKGQANESPLSSPAPETANTTAQR